MLKLTTSNLQKINHQHGLSVKDLESKISFVHKYLQKISARNQGFYKVIDDNEMLKKIESFAKSVEGRYKSIVVLGIGGSALGTICLQQSLKHLFQNELNENPKLYVLDNIDPTLIAQIEDVIDYPTTVFIVISKSGTTPEIATQYFYFRKKCAEKNLPVKEHFIFITDPKTGFLRKIANEESLTAFDIPENVGGRFSVLTACGLLPAKLIGIDIKKLLEGARKQRDNFLNENFEQNQAYKLAAIQYLLSQKGKSITVLMPYAQNLIRLADWYRQLLAESISKKFDNNHKEIYAGLTPINALGVTDQHSQSQLYNEGPNDKLIIFIEVEKFKDTITIPNIYPDNPELDFLNKEITFNKLLQIEKEATQESLTKNDRPNITIKIDQINEESLGELIMFFEASIAFLGEFYEINAFDQPGVELSKKLTKEYLLKAQ